jgi:uncharacterized protein
MEFEWDARKAAANLQKHGVSFEEASSVFYDWCAITIRDEEHSDEEVRLKTIGVSSKLRVLLVVQTELIDGVIRIISARKAGKRERTDYENEVRQRLSENEERE